MLSNVSTEHCPAHSEAGIRDDQIETLDYTYHGDQEGVMRLKLESIKTFSSLSQWMTNG